jgi:hypothetical protein
MLLGWKSIIDEEGEDGDEELGEDIFEDVTEVVKSEFSFALLC